MNWPNHEGTIFFELNPSKSAISGFYWRKSIGGGEYTDSLLCQFTCNDFAGVLKVAGVRISMDGKGRWRDNIFIERFWRTLKYECVYLREFDTGFQAVREIGAWLNCPKIGVHLSVLSRQIPLP